MNTTISTTSAGEGLHTYGLVGIDLQRAAERRYHGPSAGRTAHDAPGVLYRLRQATGDAVIRIGIALAGSAARPTAPTTFRPKADMA